MNGQEFAPMNRQEFERLALIYGATMARWPEEHQRAARRLLEQQPGLMAVLDVNGGKQGLLHIAMIVLLVTVVILRKKSRIYDAAGEPEWHDHYNRRLHIAKAFQH